MDAQAGHLDIAKAALRREMRGFLKTMSAEASAAQSQTIMEKIEAHPAFRSSGAVLLFCPMADEPQIQPLIERWHRRKRLYLPVISGEMLKVGVCNGMQGLSRTNAFGIPEPEPLPCTPPLDIAIVCGLAFDLEGNRLGRGRGYYDRLLQKIDVYKIGVCFDFQVLPCVPHAPSDVPMNEVICG